MNPKFKDLAFDAVIPSQLLFNENVCPSCIKLYAFIRGLARLEGYCYATNGYLSECMSVEERHVQRLLSLLEDEGFIDIKTDKQGIHWVRKIYVGVDLKKCLRKDKNVTPPCQKSHPPTLKMSPNKGYTIEDIQKNTTIPPQNQDSKPPKSKKQNDDVSSENLMKALKDKEKVERALAYWCKHEAWIRKKATKSLVGFLVDLVRNDRDLIEDGHLTIQQKNEQWAKEIVKRYGEKYKIELMSQGIMFIFSGGVGQYVVNFGEEDFEKKVKERLEKMGMKIDTLDT